MDTLPPELINIIATFILKITDKRQFTQTCKSHNKIVKLMIQNQESTLKLKHFKYQNYDFMGKFTLELCNDSYFNKIPNCYLGPKNDIIVRALTIYGQIELLTQAINNGCELFKEIDDHFYYSDDRYNDNSCSHAIISGNIDMLIFVRSHECKWNKETFELAAKCNHLHMLKSLKNLGCEISEYASIRAAENGNIEMMEWIIENNCGIHGKSSQAASCFGHLDMLKLLRKNNCYWDNYTCSVAARNGHLECLQWLIENGCELDVSYAYSRAACCNQLHIIKWMRSKGYMWDSKICVAATSSNHFELLKWLVKEGCELNKHVYNVALCKVVENNNPEILQWLIDNNCPRY